MVQREEEHAFLPLTSYVCTLSHGCFENMEKAQAVGVQSRIMPAVPVRMNLATAQHLTLTPSSLLCIQNLLESSASSASNAITIDDDNTNASDTRTEEH